MASKFSNQFNVAILNKFEGQIVSLQALCRLFENPEVERLFFRVYFRKLYNRITAFLAVTPFAVLYQKTYYH